ncbi:hypothetical protein M2165_000813 [Variovorax sp. TBS-050B]|uniref:DUF2938 domain-containing protein n=1 Tax=Variovorax sp. TBS-050B TaxID=2940551 RepID=UPI0024763C58|nr:DUF2938 domain-containing protein [Variovorax sp. TBS-050B]MDH6590924.1 hypothetical protein [Variovorax sp. TBS-050B]
MSEAIEFAWRALLIGAGATLVMDGWTLARKRLFGRPSLDYALVGRWVGHMTRGRFMHDPIAASAPVRGERALGWAVHYATGIGFAAVLLALAGPGWARSPTLWPALALGIGSVAVPFLVMQPALGAGIAARRTPRPAAARLQSLATHGVFGLGLYAAAWLTRGWP